MTIASETNKSGPYFGNGVTTTFPFDFKIDNAAHIRVVAMTGAAEVDLALSTDYTVTGVGGSGGGSVILTSPPLASTAITLVRSVPFTQEMDLQNQGAFFAEAIETGFDLSVARDQQLAEEMSRAVKVPVSSDPTDIETLVGGVVALLGRVGDISTVAGIAGDVSAVSLVSKTVDLGELAEDIAAVLVGGPWAVVDGSVSEASLASSLAQVLGRVVATRSALKALNTSLVKTAYLTEMGREGSFVWRAGDYSAPIAADTLEGIYIKANAVAATAGAWVRAFDGRNNSASFWGLPSVTLFGALGDNSFNNATVFASLPPSTDVTFRVPSGVYVIGTNCTISANIALDPGVVILVAAGVTVTCNGKVYAQDSQVFLRYGSSASHFYFGTKNKRIPINWFYVPDDNGTASISPFVNDQMELWPNDGREFLLPKGKRLLDTVWNLRDRNFCSIRGAGGLIRSQIDTNTIPKWPGGGSSLVLAPGLDYAIYVPDSGITGKRISGLTIDGVGFIGNSEKTVNQGGIFINEDNDGVIIQNCFFINLVGQFGILAYNADAMTIENNWIAEGTRSIKVENSIELRIINNHLGAQPGGITLDLVNAERFLVSNNNIFPDGHTNIAVTNSRIGDVADNVMHSRFVGAVVITGCYAVGLIDNIIRVPHNTTTTFPAADDPLARDTQYGIVRVVNSDDCLIDGNQIWSFLPANSAVVRHVSGNRCEYVGGMIRGNASTAKFVQDAGSDVKVIDLVNAATEATFNGGTRAARYKP